MREMYNITGTSMIAFVLGHKNYNNDDDKNIHLDNNLASITCVVWLINLQTA